MKHLKVFTTKTCGPCKSLKPLLADLPIKVVEVDIDAQPAVAGMHQIRSVPTLKFYDDSTLVRTHVGSCTKQFLLDFIKV